MRIMTADAVNEVACERGNVAAIGALGRLLRARDTEGDRRGLRRLVVEAFEELAPGSPEALALDAKRVVASLRGTRLVCGCHARPRRQQS